MCSHTPVLHAKEGKDPKTKKCLISSKALVAQRSCNFQPSPDIKVSKDELNRMKVQDALGSVAGQYNNLCMTAGGSIAGHNCSSKRSRRATLWRRLQCSPMVQAAQGKRDKHICAPRKTWRREFKPGGGLLVIVMKPSLDQNPLHFEGLLSYSV